jgi:sugar lactone lactonase YvrE
MDDDQTLFIADWGNDRIVEWTCGATTGKVVAGGNGRGNRTDQLYHPTDVLLDKETDSFIISDMGNRRVVRWPRRDGTSGEVILDNIDCTQLAMDNQRFLYVSDCQKNEVRRFSTGETEVIVVAGGNGQGRRLNQLHFPTYLFVDRDYSVYVSDTYNHRVMKWAKDASEGIVVAGGRGLGDDWTQSSSPNGVIVDLLGTLYVADLLSHRVMRWHNGVTQIAGGNGDGANANQLDRPSGLSFDRYGNLFVVDHKNHRVQRFDIVKS